MDKINEFDDMILGAAYLGDKFYKHLKKKKMLRKRMKNKIKQESLKPLDVYIDYVQEDMNVKAHKEQELQEGIFNKLNCIRLQSVLKSYIKDLQNYLIGVKKDCGNPPKVAPYVCKALKEGAVGLKELVDETREKIKKQCSNIKEQELQEAGFETKPKGWTDDSVKQAGKTLAHTVGKKSPTSKDFFDRCVARMRGKVSSPEGYCAALKDEAHGSTYWRGKDKTSKEVKSDVRRHKNV